MIPRESYPVFLFLLLLLLAISPQPIHTTNGVTVIFNSPSSPNAVEVRQRILSLIRRVSSQKHQSPAIQGMQEGRGYSVLSAFCRALSVEKAAVAGSLPQQVAHLIDSITATLNLPYITWDANLPDSLITPPKHPIPCGTFSVRPDITQPLIDFLASWNWKNFAYLYGSADAFNRLQIIFNKVDDRDLSIGGSDSTGAFVSPWIRTASKRALPLITSGFIDTEDPETMHKSLRAVDSYLSEYAERNVLIDLGRPNVDKGKTGKEQLEVVFLWLRRMGMLRAEYNYLLVDFDLFEVPLDHYQRSGVNITGFHFLDYDDDMVKAFARDWNDSNTPLHDIAFTIDALKTAWSLKEATDNGLWKTSDDKNPSRCFSPSGKLVNRKAVKRWWPGDRIRNWLTENDITGQTGTIRFDKETCQRVDYTLILSSAFGRPRERVIAKWSRHSSWVLPVGSSNPSFFRRRHFSSLNEKISEPLDYGNILEIFRLQNRTLRVVTVLSNPFIMYSNAGAVGATSGRENFVGYCKDLADHIFKHLNLNYEIHLVKDGMYGTVDPKTDEWNGMVAEALRGDADLIIAPLTMNILRAKVIDFSEPFMNFGLSLMLRKPGKTKPGMFSFLSPLTNAVWMRMAGATIIVGLGLRIIAAISPKERVPADPNLGFNLGNCIWFSVASFVHQGIDIFPISPGARVFASIWRYICLVVMAYYTANLAAALSVERLISPINSIKDFVEKKDLPIQIGTLDSGSTKDFFTYSNDMIYKTVFQRMMLDPSVFVPTMTEGFERVRRSPYAFVAESKMIEYINHRQPCDTMMVGSTFGSKAYAVGLPANKHDMRILKEHITDAILRLRENQVLAKLYKEWWIEKGECVEGGGHQTSEPLALVNLSGVFYILITGMILALVIGVSIFAYQLRGSRGAPRSPKPIN